MTMHGEMANFSGLLTTDNAYLDMAIESAAAAGLEDWFLRSALA